MNKELFFGYLNHPEILGNRSLQQLLELVEEYPWFQSARLLYVKNLHNQGDIKFEEQLKKAAIYTGDRRRLFFLLNSMVILSEHNWRLEPKQTVEIQFQPEDFVPELTEESVETNEEFYFELLPEIPQSDEAPAKLVEDLGESLLFDFEMNTLAYQLQPELEMPVNFAENQDIGNPHEKERKLIEKFIKEQPRIIPIQPSEKLEPLSKDLVQQQESPELFTETLAKVYIKQGMFAKAKWTYEKLSLKYPEKSIYFADQIEKINRIINNQ